MSEVLELPAFRERVKRWTVAEYEKLVEELEDSGLLNRMELIRGMLIENMPKSPLHCSLAEWLFDCFIARVPAPWTVFAERPLRLFDSEPEPDVMLVAAPKQEFRQSHPTTAEVVIEVAVSTVALDRQNASLYAEAGVKEFWIVLALRKEIEVYRDPRGGVYQCVRTYGVGESLSPLPLPEASVSLAELFA